jgi:cholinesterase
VCGGRNPEEAATKGGLTARLAVLISSIPIYHQPTMLPLITLAAVLAFAAASSPCDIHTFKSVTTNNGPVLGHSAGCVLQYLGIPYAEPPVGARRFAEARKLTASKLVNASQFGDDCPQLASPPLDYPELKPHAQRIVSYFTASAGTNQSEDCLTLNIWARTTAASHSGTKPVLVFFHGGREYDIPADRSSLTYRGRFCDR